MSENYGIVYVIWCLESNKPYIGQSTRELPVRIEEHFSDARTGKKYGCVKLCNAIRKYGRENFIFRVLQTAKDQDDLNFLEIKFIKLHDSIDNGYNLTDGGSRGKHSEESKRKMSESRTGEKNHFFGKTHSEEAKKRISKMATGRKPSDEAKNKMSIAHSGEKNHFFGKTHSENSRQKIGRASKGRKITLTPTQVERRRHTCEMMRRRKMEKIKCQ